MKKRKFKLTLDVEFEFEFDGHAEWRLEPKYLKQTILKEYFYENGVELNQDIEIKEITDETKN